MRLHAGSRRSSAEPHEYRLRPTVMKRLAHPAAAVLLALVLGGCPGNSARIVDCTPGYHNKSGPDSDCVPDRPPSTSQPASPVA